MYKKLNFTECSVDMVTKSFGLSFKESSQTTPAGSRNTCWPEIMLHSKEQILQVKSGKMYYNKYNINYENRKIDDSSTGKKLKTNLLT